jgi:thiol:disulfide interchange protein
MKPFLRWAAFSLLILASGCSPKHEVKWTPYTPEKMKEAMASGEPVFAYFYAAWCHPCVMLRERTFSDPQVIAALENYHRIKFDMSFIHSEKIQKLSETYGVHGMPTLILFAPDGKEFYHRSGFVEPKRLLTVLREFRTQYSLPEPAPVAPAP